MCKIKIVFHFNKDILLVDKDTLVIERRNNTIKFQNQTDASRLQTPQGGHNVQMSMQAQLHSRGNSSP